jgi:hypothetical protein
MTTFVFAIALWLLVVVIVFGVSRPKALWHLWREPLFRYPILIIESDDWGPGPPEDATALQQLVALLARHRDVRGRHPVMTLGLLLAVPDTKRMRDADCVEYLAVTISEPQFAPVVDAIRTGVTVTVFSPQLHGMEHYWPAAVMKRARDEPNVRAWLVQEGVPRTEQLPPPLQSRWIDGSALPSRELQEEEAVLAASHEVEAFSQIFSVAAKVAVPPTFVWTERTEVGWAKAGVKFVVTPGERYFARDDKGMLISTGKCIHNGQCGDSGLMYLVRDDYMEPALGHRAERGVDAVEAKAALGRPTLLEIHRFNFTEPGPRMTHALGEIDRLLAMTLARLPNVRFISTVELAEAIARDDPELVDRRSLARIRYWLLRSARIPPLKKLAWITGAIIPAWLVYRLTCLLTTSSQGVAKTSAVWP